MTFLLAPCSRAGTVLFRDEFKGRLGEGWSWVREHRGAWRVTSRGLEVQIEPGNMWGLANDAKNVLVRPAPDTAGGEMEISVNVENHPTAQYEQVDLVWYYDDGHMVKLGRELVDGRLSIVMGREEADKTRTISITPIQGDSVRLKLSVQGARIRGRFRVPDSGEWREAGACDAPAPAHGKAAVSLQFYQGPAEHRHWARVSDFLIERAAQ